MESPAEVIQQLNSAREIVLKDPNIYPQVVPGVLRVIASNASVELRRWGADFLAEAFASPVVQPDAKQAMCLGVLDTLKGYLDRKSVLGEEEDPNVVKSAVQCASSIYAYVFRHTVLNAADSESWAKMSALKSSILRRMDTAAPGVRICCIKFVARVVQVQTPGLIADPRRPEQNEISLALVPRDHAIIPPPSLEAEASGLLDRLLGVLQDNLTDPLIVTATLNCLSALVQRRPGISPKIVAAILTFNPLKLAESSMSGRDKVAVRSMTRTTITFLHHLLKRMPNHPSIGRVQQVAERLRHSLDEVLSGKNKRSAPDEHIDRTDERKRQKFESGLNNGVTPIASQPVSFSSAGPVSYAQLFTISQDPAAVGFHVEAIPLDIVTRLLPPLLQAIPQEQLDQAISTIRQRYSSLTTQAAGSALDAAKAVLGEDEDDDYDPSAEFPGTEQVLSHLDQVQPAEFEPEIEIGPFSLPPPPPLSESQRQEYSRAALTRVFGTLADLDGNARIKGSKRPEKEKGFNQPLSSAHDRDGWVTLLARLATRAVTVENGGRVENTSDDSQALTRKAPQNFVLNDGIRQALMNYVMEDFRRRIDVAITWLNEEWYSDRLAHKRNKLDRATPSDDNDLPHYWTYTLRLITAMTPYLDVKDSKTIIRFLSEIPQINEDIMERLKTLANDPEKVQVTTQVLLYLSMFRPPVREMVLNTAQALWTENSDAKAGAAKILAKWRPAVLESKREIKTEG